MCMTKNTDYNSCKGALILKMEKILVLKFYTMAIGASCNMQSESRQCRVF